MRTEMFESMVIVTCFAPSPSNCIVVLNLGLGMSRALLNAAKNIKKKKKNYIYKC